MDGFKKRMIALGSAGILLYFVFGIFMSHNFDFDSWPILGSNYLSGRGMYDVGDYYYTPTWGYFIAFFDFVGSLFGITPLLYRSDYNVRLDESGIGTNLVSDFGYAMMIKIFMLILIIVVAYLVYELTMEITENDEKKSIFAGVLCVASPIFFLVISRNGMFETAMVMMLILSVLFLIRENYLLAGVFWALSASTKFFTSFFLFILIAYVLVKYKDDIRTGFKKLGVATIGVVGAFVVVFLPQIIDGTFLTSIGMYFGRVIPDFNNTVNLVTSYGLDQGIGVLTSFEKPYKILVMIAIFLISLFLAYCYYKKGKDNLKLFSVYLIITAIAIFVIPIGGEQFYVTAVPFLCIGAVAIDKKIGIFSVISMAAFGVSSILSSPQTEILVFQNWMGNISDITNLTTPFMLRGIMYAIGCIFLALCLYVVLKKKWREINE